MEKKETYRLNKIILLESHFRREPEINFQNNQTKNDINIDIKSNVKDKIINVVETLDFRSYEKDKNNVEAKIVMAGIFESCDKPPVSVENFVEVNAPAIIFPFIREHLSTVSLKAGIKPILLPPVNFIELAKNRKEKSQPT